MKNRPKTVCVKAGGTRGFDVKAPFLSAARAAARAADDKKALDVRVYDLRRSSALTDFCLVATVESSPQMAAVEDEIARRLSDEGLAPLRRDGSPRAPWRVVDFGGLVVHLMDARARAFYGLERLWESARSVPWEPTPPRRRAS